MADPDDDPPVFLERAAYRRRRLGDAARLLPVLTLAAVLLPVWISPGQVSGRGGALWFLGIWAVVVVLILVLHRRLRRQGWRNGEARRDEL